MKRQIRREVFETNSSSVHSITMCLESEFEQWKNGELLWDRWNGGLTSRDEAIADLKEDNEIDWADEEALKMLFRDEGMWTYDDFINNYDFETYVSKYTTANGEKIVTFGYYGHD